MVSTGPKVCRLSMLQDLPEVGSGPLVVCSMPFVPFLLCLWCIALEYGSISRFEGVFSAFWGADVCVYGLRLCLDCVAFVRVRCLAVI